MARHDAGRAWNWNEPEDLHSHDEAGHEICCHMSVALPCLMSFHATKAWMLNCSRLHRMRL